MRICLSFALHSKIPVFWPTPLKHKRFERYHLGGNARFVRKSGNFFIIIIISSFVLNYLIYAWFWKKKNL